MRRTSIFVFLLSSCMHKASNNCTLTISELLKSDPNRVFVSDLIGDTSIEVRDNKLESTSGLYSFNKNGSLKSYKFFVNSDAYTYNEEYNNGSLIRIDGKPLVYRKIKEVNKDSAYVKCYFVSLNKTYRNIAISINKSQQFHPNLLNDTLYSNMKLISFGINTREYSFINIYFNISFISNCANKKITINDTISLFKKNGRLEMEPKN